MHDQDSRVPIDSQARCPIRLAMHEPIRAQVVAQRKRVATLDGLSDMKLPGD